MPWPALHSAILQAADESQLSACAVHSQHFSAFQGVEWIDIVDFGILYIHMHQYTYNIIPSYIIEFEIVYYQSCRFPSPVARGCVCM